MKSVLLLFAFCVFVACSHKKDGNDEVTIGSSFIKNESNTDTLLSAESYTKESLAIIDEHKKKLKVILPQMILSEVEIYKKTLAEIEKKTALTYNLSETNKSIEIERNIASKTILDKEIEINQIYFQLFNELTLLNHKYKTLLPKKEFKNFYDAGPIVLAEEVMIKIDELVKDENKRIVAENKKQNKEFALTFVAFIPVAGQLKGILGGVTQAAQHIIRGVKLPQNSKSIAKKSYELMNKKVATFIAKTFKNDKIRTTISYGIDGQTKKGIRNVPTYLSSEQAGEMFKVLENKINGRIGDFSDGVLAVHIQRVRDIAKVNAELIH